MNGMEETKVVPAGAGLVKLLALFGAGALLLALHASVAGRHWSDPRAMGDLLAHWGLGGAAGFLLVASVLTFAGLPRLVFFGLGGLLLGFTEGFAVAMVATLIGSFASFALLRWGGRDWLARRYGGRKWIGKITGIEPKVLSVVMVRQLPVSNVIINAGLAMSRVKGPAFLLGSLLGFIPQGAAASLIGSGSSKNSVSEGSLQMAGAAVVLVLMGLWAWHVKSRKDAAAAEEVAS